MDWSGRARTSVQESKRYTRFVGVMKRVLFFAAMAILAVVVAYSVQPRRQDKVAIAVQTLSAFLKSGKQPAQKITLLTPVAITKDNLKTAERLGEVK